MEEFLYAWYPCGNDWLRPAQRGGGLSHVYEEHDLLFVPLLLEGCTSGSEGNGLAIVMDNPGIDELAWLKSIIYRLSRTF